MLTGKQIRAIAEGIGKVSVSFGDLLRHGQTPSRCIRDICAGWCLHVGVQERCDLGHWRPTRLLV